jgi:chromate transporter
MDARAFEDANAACSLLPGPASTQLAIFCAYRVGGSGSALGAKRGRPGPRPLAGAPVP